jgi:hypothetical protein
MQIGKVSQSVGLRAYQAQSPNLSGSPSKSHSHDVRETKARSRDKSQDPTEFARALERAMTK